MATMLAFIVTDAVLPASVLRTLLKEGADKSFNCTTVDGDTSTSDTLLAFATARLPISRKFAMLRMQALAVFARLSMRFCSTSPIRWFATAKGQKNSLPLKSPGAASEAAAKRIALTIANSPLVKTAVAGEDANWGRIVMAVGKAGEKAERDRLRIRIGGVAVAAKASVSQAMTKHRLPPI
jgi:glutamate N-acetyltransferase/amino-acid N-acetyltransferase